MFNGLADYCTVVERPPRMVSGAKLKCEVAPNCPRCASANTKFCYYNNYSLSQPRYFCKCCRRYWTEGGSLRNIPVGGSCRKNRRDKPTKHDSRAEYGVASSAQRSLEYEIPMHFMNDLTMMKQDASMMDGQAYQDPEAGLVYELSSGNSEDYGLVFCSQQDERMLIMSEEENHNWGPPFDFDLSEPYQLFSGHYYY